jgi:hypothetical protein
MAVNSLGLTSFEPDLNQDPALTGMRYAGMTAEQIAEERRPPPPRPMPPLPPRRLPAEEIATRLRDIEQGLGRLERARDRGTDCQLLIAELRGALQLLSGELNGIYRDIGAGKIVPSSPMALDTAFFSRARKAKNLLIDLCVSDSDFLPVAQTVFEFLKSGFPGRPGLPVPES